MGFLGFFKKIFSRGKVSVVTGFWNDEQTYEISFETILSNNSSHEKNIAVILPKPLEDDFQKITSKATFEPSTELEGEDEEFKNPYALLRVKLPPGNKASVQEKFTVKVFPQSSKIEGLNIDDYRRAKPHQKYLESNRYIKVNEETKRIADHIVEGERDLENILQKVNDYVVGRLRYGAAIKGLYSSEDALRRAEVDCGGFDSLLVTLYRSLGIPARIISGFWIGYPQNNMHAWVEIMLPDGVWVPADPSVEKLKQEKRSEKVGWLGFAGSDRLKFSHGCDIGIPLDGHTEFIPLLQHPALFAREGLTGLEVETSLLSKRLI